MSAQSTPKPIRVVGRYALFDELAAGGMATVHVGRLLGPVGFSRTVAIKRLHPQFAKDPDFVSMFVDEARLAARIRHPNVVQTLDVVSMDAELFLVMDYVHGESLARLLRACHRNGTRMAPQLVATIMAGVLHGLHAAHEARNERGEPLHLVHRDVSPHNVLVGVDGVPRVLDFGVAKAAGRVQTTAEGQVKGKLAYMAPEQLNGDVSRRTDVFAAGIVLWEALTGRRLFDGANQGETISRLLNKPIDAPSAFVADLPETLDAVTLRALQRDPEARFASAREMALALESATSIVPASGVGTWVEEIAAEVLAQRAAVVARIELASPPGSEGGGPDAQPILVESDTSKATTVERPTKEDASSIAVSTGSGGGGRRTVVWLAALAVVATVGVFGALRFWGEGSTEVRKLETTSDDRAVTTTSASIAQTPPVTTSASIAQTPPVTSATTTTLASTTASAPLVATTAAPSASVSSKPAPTNLAHPAATKPIPTKSSVSTPKCAPYEIGPDGFKIFHPECMK